MKKELKILGFNIIILKPDSELKELVREVNKGYDALWKLQKYGKRLEFFSGTNNTWVQFNYKWGMKATRVQIKKENKIEKAS